MSSCREPPCPRSAMLSRAPSSPENKLCTTGSTSWSGARGGIVSGLPCDTLRWQMRTMDSVAKHLPATDHSGQQKRSSPVIRSCPKHYGCLSYFMDVTSTGRWAKWQPDNVEWMRLLSRHVGSVHTYVTASARALGASAPAISPSVLARHHERGDDGKRVEHCPLTSARASAWPRRTPRRSCPPGGGGLPKPARQPPTPPHALMRMTAAAR